MGSVVNRRTFEKQVRSELVTVSREEVSAAAKYGLLADPANVDVKIAIRPPSGRTGSGRVVAVIDHEEVTLGKFPTGARSDIPMGTAKDTRVRATETLRQALRLHFDQKEGTE